MKKHFLVKVIVNDPYAKEFQETIEAGNPGLAAKRAYVKVRKEQLPRKKINEWKFITIKL